MPIISFWNPHGTAQTGNTGTMVAMANAVASYYPTYKVLLCQTHFNDMKMEAAYYDMERMKNKGNMDDITDTGIDALERLLRSNKISPESIKTYSQNKGNTIEILYGSFKGDRDSFSRVLETMPFMLDYAVQCYDMVFVDLTRGVDVKEVNDILAKSDVIVVSLSQDKIVLNGIIEAFKHVKVLQDKPVHAVFSRYDRWVTYNSRNILRNFDLKIDKKEVYTIPYNSQFFESMNDGRSLNFFFENLNADPTTRNGQFMSEVKHSTDKLLKMLGDKISDK